MRLSTKGRYGVRAMYELAKHYGDAPMSIKEIAVNQGFSDSYIEQLFSSLKKSGLIVSLRGARGGYRLSRPPEDITVGEILRVLEGPIEFADCAGGASGQVCSMAADCVTRGLWQEISAAVNDIIDHKTLADLTASGKVKNAAEI
ncbi:MAG: Rrf2 family transcriptional regulator [Eubacterium sp.]|nr:Rrf2 family transcriptional regulator [Eubacterium sp.]